MMKGQLQKSSDFENIRLSDGGKVYAETDLSNFIAEPWNAATAFLFVLLVLYWLIKVLRDSRRQTFLLCVLPILFIGGVGGTLFHGLRTSKWFLLMDWLPIMLLSLGGSLYFFWKVFPKWWAMIAYLTLGLLLEFLVFRIFPGAISINISYAILALLVLSPTFLVLYKTSFRNILWVVLSLIIFGLAVIFRSIDNWQLLPMGTHFLWHLFGALACHFIFEYTYTLNRLELKDPMA